MVRARSLRKGDPEEALSRHFYNEVSVRWEWESRSIVEVIGTVESWLAADRIDSGKLSVGNRSYTMVGPGEPRSNDRTSRVTTLLSQRIADGVFCRTF